VTSGVAGTRRNATLRPSGQKLASPPSSVVTSLSGALAARTCVTRIAPDATPAATPGPVSNEKWRLSGANAGDAPSVVSSVDLKSSPVRSAIGSSTAPRSGPLFSSSR